MQGTDQADDHDIDIRLTDLNVLIINDYRLETSVDSGGHDTENLRSRY